MSEYHLGRAQSTYGRVVGEEGLVNQHRRVRPSRPAPLRNVGIVLHPRQAGAMLQERAMPIYRQQGGL
jgi:hypothetical protein